MTLRAQILRVLAQEDLNFLLTNRIPRRLATQFMGWFSQIQQPLVRDLSIALWRFFSDLDLSEAKQPHFRSMHDCFIRQLKEGARPIDDDPKILVSPCDAIVGASGTIAGTRLYQIKGFPYTLAELFCDRVLANAHRDGRYVTLRLTSSMYHRFHERTRAVAHETDRQRPHHYAGPGRGRACRRHPPALSRRSAQPQASRTQCHRLRRGVQERR